MRSQGVKLSDKRTVDSLSLQPGHFLVAVQTQKRAESAPAPLHEHAADCRTRIVGC